MLDDKIGVIPADDTQTYFDPFVNKNSELADTAIFEGVTASAADYYSIYPYDKKAILQSDSIIFNLLTTFFLLASDAESVNSSRKAFFSASKSILAKIS